MELTNNNTKPTDSLYKIYVEIYFEIPYNIFNIVSFIVLMQWVQLWATLYDIVIEQKQTLRETIAMRRTSNDELMRNS